MEKFSQENSKENLLQDKKYSKIKTSNLLHFFASKSSSQDKVKKKILASNIQPGLREEFKKTFLPLLIDVFELRQMIETYKLQKTSPELSYLGKVSKTPQEILKQLEQLQNDIEESQRWCSGVILQISKGIQEAKEALEILEHNKPSQQAPSKTKSSAFKTLLKKLRLLK